jgi:hypothetical protein
VLQQLHSSIVQPNNGTPMYRRGLKGFNFLLVNLLDGRRLRIILIPLVNRSDIGDFQIYMETIFNLSANMYIGEKWLKPFLNTIKVHP